MEAGTRASNVADVPYLPYLASRAPTRFLRQQQNSRIANAWIFHRPGQESDENTCDRPQYILIIRVAAMPMDPPPPPAAAESGDAVADAPAPAPKAARSESFSSQKSSDSQTAAEYVIAVFVKRRTSRH